MAAEAGESRSRSQGAGSSAPFWGRGVIHPARPRRTALRVQHVSLPAAPAHTCRTRGSNLPKGPLRIPLLSLPGPLPFIYIPSSAAANQKEKGATRSQSGSGGGTIARWLYSDRPSGSGDAVLTPAQDSRRLTTLSARPLPWRTRPPPGIGPGRRWAEPVGRFQGGEVGFREVGFRAHALAAARGEEKWEGYLPWQ